MLVREKTLRTEWSLTWGKHQSSRSSLFQERPLSYQMLKESEEPRRHTRNVTPGPQWELSRCSVHTGWCSLDWYKTWVQWREICINKSSKEQLKSVECSNIKEQKNNEVINFAFENISKQIFMFALKIKIYLKMLSIFYFQRTWRKSKSNKQVTLN